MLCPVTTTAPYLRPLLLHLPSSSGAKPLPEQGELSSQVTPGLNVLNRAPLAYAGIWYYGGKGRPIFSYQETIVSYGTRFVVCDIRTCRLQEALPSPSVLTPCDYRMLQGLIRYRPILLRTQSTTAPRGEQYWCAPSTTTARLADQ